MSIVAIDISIALLGVTVTFRYLDEYEFEAYYERYAPSFKWMSTDNLTERMSVDVELEIEQNEKEIVEWLETQFLAEQYATA
ncbi:MAG TPA: hypothetical protein VFG54_12335 [Prolixibacteraceae bacterium]|nr:hypothetical protein [Prolixibacteraceae bacterium]